MASALKKPTFTKNQLISSSVASKTFGEIRKKAKTAPQFIIHNGTVDTVVLSYEMYEIMYERLLELEEREEARVLETRLSEVQSGPESTIPWRQVRRTGENDEGTEV